MLKDSLFANIIKAKVGHRWRRWNADSALPKKLECPICFHAYDNFNAAIAQDAFMAALKLS